MGSALQPALDIDIADGLTKPAERSSDRCAQDVRVRLNHRLKTNAFNARVVVEPLRAAGPKQRNAGENFFRGLFAVAGELGKASVTSRFLELVHRLDAETFVDVVDLLRRHAGDAKQLEQPFGRRRTKLLEVSGLAVFDQIANDGDRRWTQSAHRGELAGLQRGREVIGFEPTKRASRGTIRPGLEMILPVQLEIGGDLRECVRRGPWIDRQR